MGRHTLLYREWDGYMRTSSFQDKKIGDYLTSEFADEILDGKKQTISGDMSGLIDLIADIFDVEDIFPKSTLEDWAKSNDYIQEDDCDCEVCDGDESN